MQNCSIQTGKQLQRYFKIGNFRFRIDSPEAITPPDNFLLFETEAEESVDYIYQMEIEKDCSADDFIGASSRKPAAVREDLLIFCDGNRETRLLKAGGRDSCYARYREVSGTEAIITVYDDFWPMSDLDTVFSSLFALEKRLLAKDGLILHCACVEYGGAAILFSGPSGIGKSTQASLWGTYQDAPCINGDRILLQKRDNTWYAYGWPVCGSSGICRNKTLPVRAIVMLSQAQENTLASSGQTEVFAALYSQITVNRWNPVAVCRVMDQIEVLVRDIPVYHLGCTISREAVELLQRELEG